MMRTTTLEVGGLFEELDHLGVEKQLSKLPGVRTANINPASGSATVEYDETVTAVRSQFEQLLGRSLSPDEWLRLSQHAQAHGEAMQSQFGEEGQAGPPEGAGS